MAACQSRMTTWPQSSLWPPFSKSLSSLWSSSAHDASSRGSCAGIRHLPMPNMNRQTNRPRNKKGSEMRTWTASRPKRTCLIGPREASRSTRCSTQSATSPPSRKEPELPCRGLVAGHYWHAYCKYEREDNEKLHTMNQQQRSSASPDRKTTHERAKLIKECFSPVSTR